MSNVVHEPPSGNTFQHNTGTARRSKVLLRLEKAEESAFLAFGRCQGVFEKTGAASDQINLFEARTTWDRLFSRILELEGAE